MTTMMHIAQAEKHRMVSIVPFKPILSFIIFIEVHTFFYKQQTLLPICSRLDALFLMRRIAVFHCIRDKEVPIQIPSLIWGLKSSL
jgi:hypothetical protein